LRRVIVIFVALIGFFVGWMAWKNAPSRTPARQAMGPVIIKEPAIFAQHAFDPAAPPAEMPPLGIGEEALCDSDFLSNASVSGLLRKTNATSATVTVTQVKITLGLKVNIWVPANATQHVIEHEQGHREISEHYYETADKVALQIASAYMGKQVSISGADLNEESSKALRKMSADITGEYNDQLTPGPAQQHYDDLTDHSRNDMAAKDAVAQALKEAGN